MATDPEGQYYGVGDGVWYDDGHSADWAHGTVTAFSGNNVLIRPESGPNFPVPINQTLVHRGKPANPPDR